MTDTKDSLSGSLARAGFALIFLTGIGAGLWYVAHWMALGWFAGIYAGSALIWVFITLIFKSVRARHKREADILARLASLQQASARPMQMQSRRPSSRA